MSKPTPDPKSPKKKAAKKKASKTDSTAEGESQVDQLSAILGQVKGLMDMAAPAIKFHTENKGDRAEDVKLFWDVRVVSGDHKELPLGQIVGSMTIPGLLTQSLLGNAPDKIRHEIVDKVAEPLSVLFHRKAGEVIGIELTEATAEGGEGPEAMPSAAPLTIPAGAPDPDMEAMESGSDEPQDAEIVPDARVEEEETEDEQSK